MSRIGNKLCRRIMAAALSVAMIMSNMTVYATQVSDEPISAEDVVVDEDIEIVDEDAEVVEDVNENTTEAEDADELTYVEEETAEMLYSVGAADVDENEEGGDISAQSDTSGGYDFVKDSSTEVTGVTATNFAQSSSGHGFLSSAADATMKFTAGEVGSTVDIDVLLCAYGAGTNATMTSSVNNESIVSWVLGENGQALATQAQKSIQYSVLGVTGGTEVTLTFSNNTYVHKITVTPRDTSKTYSAITLNNTSEGDTRNGINENSVYISKKYAAEGETITLTAVPKSGFAVKTWSVKDGSDNAVAVTPNGSNANEATFSMPSSAATVEVEFEQAGVENNVSISSDTIEGGSISAKGSKTTAISDSTVVIGEYASFTANEGWHFSKWTVTNNTSNEPVSVTKSNSGQYVFTMPANAVTISAEFEADDTTTRTSWNFLDKDDDTLYGVDNTVDYSIGNGTTGTIAGLTIEGKGQWGFFTKGKYSEKSNGAVASDGTIIKVPVDGPCSVNVVLKFGGTNYTIGTGSDIKAIDSNSTTASYNYTGTSKGTVDITIGACTNQNNGNGYDYIQSIEVVPTTTYTITAQSTDDATITPADTPLERAAAGTPVQISQLVKDVTINSDKASTHELTGWTVKYEENNEQKTIAATEGAGGDYTFTMPSANVTVTPVITVIGAAKKYSITILDGHHGTAAAKTGATLSVDENSTVTLNDVAEATPESDDYTFAGWYVTQTTATTSTGDDGVEKTTYKTEKIDVTETSGTYTFMMPSNNVYVMPIFTGAASGTYNFRQQTADNRAQNSELDDFGTIQFANFVDEDNGHGFKTNANASMTMTLSDKAEITVDACRYSDGATKAMTATLDSDTLAVDDTTVGAEGGTSKVYKVTTDKAGTLVLGFANAQNYIHSVTVVYLKEYNISVTPTVEHATISTTGKTTSAMVGQSVKLKDVVEVTIAEADADKYVLSGWTVTYGTDNASVTVTKDADGDDCFIMPAGNVTVTPKVIEINPYPTWNFSDSDFQNGDYAPANNDNGYEYKGLLISANKDVGAYNSKYLQLKNNATISIPVMGNCTITATTQYGQSYYFDTEDEGEDKTQTGGSGSDELISYSYDYIGEAGYVVIKAPGQTYFTKIVVSPLAQKFNVTVDTNVDHATVTLVTDAPAQFTENKPVKISDLVASITVDTGYEHVGWEATETVSGDTVEVDYNETDGYTFTMPSAAVTVKAKIEEEAQDRIVTVVPKAGTETLTAEDLEGAKIVFENQTNPANSPTITVGTGTGATALNAITLKDGTYKVTVYNSKLYAIQPTEEFTVSETSRTCTLNFDKNPKYWYFGEKLFGDYYATDGSLQWYNGLELNNVTKHNDYAYLLSGSSIKIPVLGECNVTITYYGGSDWKNATFAGKPYVTGEGNPSLTYHYQDNEPGTVLISASGLASVRTITITDPVPAPAFRPVNTDTAKSDYTFKAKAGQVFIESADTEATVKYVVSTDYADDAAAFEAITEDTILSAGDKLKDAQPIKVESNNTVIKAVAVKGDNITSKLVSYTYSVTADGAEFVSAPKAEPAGGIVPVGQEVVLTAAEGVEIYYTLNDDTPTTGSLKYDKETKPIILNTAGDKTVRAIAVKDGSESAELICRYTVVQASKLNSVSIDGQARPSKTLTATPRYTGTPGDNTTTVYEWFKVTKNAAGEDVEENLNVSSNTYTIPETGFEGAQIRVKVTFTNELNAVSTAEDTSAVIKKSQTTGKGLEIEFIDEREQTYKGSAITPEIAVTNNGDLLTEGTDYTVKYTNNIKVADAKAGKKAPTVTVTGKGNLSGKTSATFTIKPRSLTDKDIVAGTVVVTENAKATSALVILYNGTKLTAKDYEVTAPTDFKTHKWATTDAGEDKITVKGKAGGNFSDQDELKLDVEVISKEEAKNAKIKADFADKQAVKKLTYTGDRIEPAMAVSTKATDASGLTPDVDYRVSYPDDATNVGTKKVTVVGISKKCTGSVTKSYKIQPASKEGSLKVEFKDVAEGVAPHYGYVSTGVTFGEEASVDYVYTDANNAQQSETLKPGVDYKFVYSGNKKAGTAKYSVTGLGNYKGLKTPKAEFIIDGLKLEEGTDNVVIASDKIFNKPGVYKSVPIVVVDGALVKASEYKVEYQVEGETAWSAKPARIESVASEAGTKISVKITPKKATGNYGGEVADGKELKGEYYVINSSANKVDFSKAKITFQNQDGTKAAKLPYTGEKVTPYKAVIKCKGAPSDIEVVLDETSDEFATKGYEALGFDVTFANNIAKGKATVIIAAKSTNTTYAGSKSATFTIAQKNLKTGLIQGEGFVGLGDNAASFIKSLLEK